MDEEVIRTRRPINNLARSVFEELLVSGPLSRAELARRLSMSAASLTKITRPLLDANYLREGQAVAHAGAGRPSQPIELDPDFAHFVGIKLTGEALFAVLTNAHGVVLADTEATFVSQEVDDVVAQVVSAIETLRADDPRVAGVGISLSGNATRDEPTVRKSPFLHWYGVPLATLITEKTGLPAVLDNDVRALTAAEHWFGEGADADSFALLTFGAGIGCGMVANGAQIEGRLGASGLIGHLPIDDRGPMCYAGHRGCAHAFATTAGIVKTVSMGLGVSPLTYQECVDLARAGNGAATTAFQESGRAIGQLIATVVNIMGPERVLIAGEGVEMFQLGEEAARARLSELLHWTATEPEIRVQPFNFTEWARGAAVVAIQEHIRNLTSVLPTNPGSPA